jgi:glycosyltransferase involved in cell wall biosynthesis
MIEIMSPLISVVIPSYNHGRYLGRALQSVLDQTYTNWEAIIIDNHSTDNTDEVMATFSDSRIAYLKIHNNGVIAVSRNAGIKAAKGQWVAFLDSDDWWTIDKLQTCFDYINDNVDLVYHDLEIVTEKPQFFRQKVIKSWQVKSPVLIDLLVSGNAIATSSVVVRAKLLKQLNGMCESPDMVAAEDYNTWLRIAQLTDGFRHVSKQLGFYQLHNQGISRKDMSVPIQNAVAEFFESLSPQQRNKFIANLRYTKGRFDFLAGNYVDAKKNLTICILNGSRKTRLKALYMYIMSIIYLNINFISFSK